MINWYKYLSASIAVLIATLIAWLVISGWLLNHSDSLNLAQHKIHSPALARWYNLDYVIPTKVFNSQHHWLVNNNETLLLDGKVVDIPFSKAIGLTQNKQFIAIANNHKILLLDNQYKIIDKLNSSSLPFNYITKIGNGCEGIAITDVDDNNPRHTLASQDGTSWQPCDQPIIWSTARPINTLQLKKIEPQLTPEISVEKIIIDLHTGRFFGHYGACVVDLISLCLLLLALSRVWLFLGSARKKN